MFFCKDFNFYHAKIRHVKRHSNFLEFSPDISRLVTFEICSFFCCIRKLRTISGEWFYEKVSERLKPQNASHIHASNVIRDSIRLKKNHSSAGNSPVAVKRGIPVQVGGNAQGHHVIQQATTVSPRHHPKSRTLSGKFRFCKHCTIECKT